MKKILFLTFLLSLITSHVFADVTDELFLATVIEDLPTIKYIVEKGRSKIKLNQENSSGDTLLSIAIRSGNQLIVSYLLDNGVDIEKTDEHRDTPLMQAIKQRKLNIAMLLIEKGASVDPWNFAYETAGSLAIKNGYQKFAKQLFTASDIYLEQLIEPDIINDIYKTYSYIYHSLKEDAKNLSTPLMEAVYNNDFAKLASVLATGVDPNEQNMAGKTALMLAAAYASSSIIQSLIDYGADLEIIDNYGYTALAYAVANRDDSYKEELLLKYLADPLGGKSLRYSPFVVALANNNIRVMNRFLNILSVEKILEVEQRNAYSLLSYASVVNDYYLVEKLLRKGVDVNARDEYDRTALQALVMVNKDSYKLHSTEDYLNIAKLLVSNGATVDDINVDPEDRRLLRVLASSSTLAILSK